MCLTMPSPQQLQEAPELAILVSLAYSLEATQLALAANYPSLYENESDLDDDHTEQSAYARALYAHIDPLISLVDGYQASVRRALSLANRRPPSADNISF